MMRGMTKALALGGIRHAHREPFQACARKPLWVSAEDAMKTGRLKSGDRVFVQGFGATPGVLLDSLFHYAQRRALRGITLYHLILEGHPLWATGGDTEDMMDIHETRGMRSNSLFVGRNMRASVAAGTSDYVPIFLSDIPRLLLRTEIDLALIQVSPPDPKGYCSLGVSVDVTRSALRTAKRIVALANPNMPRSFGDGIIHSSNIDVMVYGEYPLATKDPAVPTDVHKRIGEHIAELVKDRATLQIGTGQIPTAAAMALRGHKELGIHTETFSDEVMALVECGAVTNEHKRVHQGKCVGSWVFGSKKLYDWIDDNPLIYLGSIDWVNEPAVISKNPRATAINSALEVDLTGQVVADTVGGRIVSGFGGQLDFIRGAARSSDGEGLPIVALASRTAAGAPKLVPRISPGSGVVTTRAHVDYVVTEYGAVSLFGKNLRQRAHALIGIAHPGDREALEKAAFEHQNQAAEPY